MFERMSLYNSTQNLVEMRFLVFLVITLIVSLPAVLAAQYDLVYDANGNLLSGDGFNRTYNGLNQLDSVVYENGTLLYQYKFHPTEERVHVKNEYYENGTLKETTVYVSSTFVTVVNESGTHNLAYISHEGQKIAEADSNGEKQFIHIDHLGSSTVVTNSSGDVIENTTYSPFGSIVQGGTAVRYGYEGKEHDSTTGMVDFHFRQYKSDFGIFPQPDSLLPDVYDPQQLNRYAFERNNPYRYVDPSGHASCEGWRSCFELDLGFFKIRIGPITYDEGDDTYQNNKISQEKDSSSVRSENQWITAVPVAFGTFLTAAPWTFSGSLSSAVSSSSVSSQSSVSVNKNSVMSKLEGYSLNPNHPSGGNKARVFESALGYTRENADDLGRQLSKGFDTSKAYRAVENHYGGTQYSQIIDVTGPNGRTVSVNTGWHVVGDEARLSTAFVSNT